MVETELKFQVPVASRPALRRALDTPGAATRRLRARYFDTADRRLAAAGIALRLRREGRLWVQTLKGPGTALAQRVEHEVGLPPGEPALDLSRHDGTPAADLLRAALGRDAPPLEPVFETDVRRTQRVLRVGGARIEAALDVGTLRADGRSEPVFELELELRHGALAALYAEAARWAQRHALWLDVRSKAERGELLSRAARALPAAGMQRPALDPAMTVDDALRAMAAAALAQALPNAAAIAAGVGDVEHLHQLRVGLRRLRSVLRLFAGVPNVADALWSERLAGLFRALGGTRDRDVLVTSVLPELQAAGGPAVALPAPPPAADVGAVLRAPEATRLLLELMAYADAVPLSGGDAVQAAARSIAALARRRLARLDRRLSVAARRFGELDVEHRHRLRRQIKRLRYGVEATQGLWPRKACRAYLDGLRPLQEALGECNDLQVAAALLGDPAPDAAAAWFARGWLAARQRSSLEAAVRALRRWPDAPRAWRRR